MRLWSLLAAILLLCGTRPTGAQSLAAPPFVRQWTQRVGDGAFVVFVEKDIVYYQCDDGVGAIALTTGELLWKSLAGKRIVETMRIGRTLFALVPGEKHSTIYALDMATGKSQVRIELPRTVRHLTADDTNLYVLDEAGQLLAYKAVSGHALWSRTLVSKPTRGITLAKLAATSSGVYVGLDEAGEFGVDSRTGKLYWSRRVQYAGLYPPLVVEGDVVTQHGRLQRTSVRTGKTIWQTTADEGGAEQAGNVIVSGDGKLARGRDIATGRVLWKLPLPYSQASVLGIKDIGSVTDGRSVLLHDDFISCVTSDGKLRWRQKKPFTGTPVYADKTHVVTMDVIRLMCYMTGKPRPLPPTEPEKKALAERLARSFEEIDEPERKQLESLKPYSFPPFLACYLEWARAYDANPDGPKGYELYHLIIEARPYLLSLCEKENTAAMVAGWKSLDEKSSWRRELESVLQEKGDPAGYIPILVASLRKQPKAERESGAALSAVAHSSHPEAVAFLLEALRNPKAPADWRIEAFRHLAGTGGAEGVAAVRAARAKLGPRKPWYEQLEISKLNKQAILATRKDAKGRTWMLFQSAILGNYSDLYIAEKRGSGWEQPLFTGAWTAPTFRSNAPKTYRGIPIATLVKTEWIKRFPDDPTLRKDTDDDGLTDLVEARLGLNPKKADTDGDGLADAVDPCPDATPRSLGDTEKIVAACVEARFFAYDGNPPALISVVGVRPFEFSGYPGTVLWSRSSHPLSPLYGGGVNLLDFHSPEENSVRSKDFIVFSSDRLSARVIISRYSGGLNGDGTEVFLRKIEGDWFVVDFQGRYVS
ncbi:PQQ-binding-like beta-propeller repeat protein [Armatimonas sp.]|uniref:outer membrane protein assembly factor BamB family protein n=1 Tax=Armatimonas sp. TaxID=1872638 RepID=UPI00286B53AB|nr:PQQ-binding-like beta-propeller repeat protein [Armatimonas sp.]